jgi:hypothetical protein
MSNPILEVLLIGIVLFSALIAWEFYRSVDGKLRKLIIALFVTKFFLYGAYLFCAVLDLEFTGWMRVLFNFPMFVVMIELYRYIKFKK